MMYYIGFTGRRLGAIGKFHTLGKAIEAEDAKAAMRALSDTHEYTYIRTVQETTPATDGCNGCMFYKPGEPGRRWCINGGYYTPAKCATDKTIFTDRTEESKG